MANQYGYFIVEALAAMTTPQASQLLSELRLIGLEDNGQCHRRMIWRLSVTGNMSLYRGVFNDNQLTQAALRNRIATILGVPPGQVTITPSAVTFNGQTVDVYLYANNGNQYARVRVFGFANLGNARTAAQGYIRANLAQWETTL